MLGFGEMLSFLDRKRSLFCLGISLSHVYVTLIFKEKAHEKNSTEIQEY